MGSVENLQVRQAYHPCFDKFMCCQGEQHHEPKKGVQFATPKHHASATTFRKEDCGSTRSFLTYRVDDFTMEILKIQSCPVRA